MLNPTGSRSYPVGTSIPHTSTSSETTTVSSQHRSHLGGPSPSSEDGRIGAAQIRHTKLSNALLFNPPGFVAPSIQIFKEMVVKDLVALKIPRSNKNSDFQTSMKQICARNDIIIRPADKGGGIVILNKTDYLDEMNRLLSDNETYTSLASNPTTRYKKELLSLVDRAFQSGIVNKKEKAYLVPSAPSIPVIYYLPKVDKSLTKPPGRPIISGIDSVTARIGRYVDQFLQPLVMATPSHLKDTSQVIKILADFEWREGCLLATADVASLYTVISHHHGLEAVKFYLEHDHTLTTIQKEFIVDLLTSHNYF